MRANQRGSGVVYRLHSNAITERTLIFTKQLSVHLGRSACRTSTVIHLSVGTISGFIKNVIKAYGLSHSNASWECVGSQVLLKPLRVPRSILKKFEPLTQISRFGIKSGLGTLSG